MDTRAHVHALVDQLPPVQLAALATLLQSLIDPVARSAALAPPDDEPVSEEDRRRFHEGQACFASGGKGTPMEEVLAEFGLKPDDFPVHP
jgi:hypothetical protein